ncbi:MAG: DUF1292 domain-containing protein [Clostridia bacterium]|nr:DUF1292 domain-containing protein [Clostridia bacterium]
MIKNFEDFEEYSELDELEELDSLNDSDILTEEIVEIADKDGTVYEYYQLGILNYEEKSYAFFTPAEEIDEVSENQIVVYELVEEESQLVEVDDEALLNRLFIEFTARFKGEYVESEEELN